MPMFAECPICHKIFRKVKSVTKYCSRHCQGVGTATFNRRPRAGQILPCVVCGEDFYVPQYRIDGGKAKYCSRSCLAKDHLAQYTPIYGFKKSGAPPHKYKTITTEDGTQVREHRDMMEKFLGRKLTSDEHVHHINDDSQDNRIENFIVLTNAEHQFVEYMNRKLRLSRPPALPLLSLGR